MGSYQEILYCPRFGAVAVVVLRLQVSCDVLLCHWMSGFCHIEGTCPLTQHLIPKYLNSQ